MYSQYANKRRALVWELYLDEAGEWRWRARSPNGEIVGASSEGYKRHEDCRENAKLFGAPHTLPFSD